MPFSSGTPSGSGSQQPLSIPSGSSSSSPSINHHYPPTGTSFPRQSSYGQHQHQYPGYPHGQEQGQGGPSRWENSNSNSNTNASGGGNGMSGLSAMMRSRGGGGNGGNDMEIGSSPPGYANSSLSSNPHSGFHPSSYGPNMPFQAIALGISHHQQPNAYMNTGMGMSISPPHWASGSVGSASYVESMGNFGGLGTSLNSRDRELEARYVKDFSCCGKKLNGLHELLEHYEEEHANLAPDVRMAAISAAQNSMNGLGPGPGLGPGQIPGQPPNNRFNTNGPIPPTPTSITHHSDVPAPPGMMDIEMDEPTTHYPSTLNYHPHQQHHPRHLPHPQGMIAPSNPWAAAFRPQLNNSQPPQCVPPSLLSYAPPTPGSSTGTSTSTHPNSNPGAGGVLTPEQLQAKALRKAQKKAERAAREEMVTSDDAEGGGERRYPCPIEGCDKVYKQANGLKYHLTRSINSGHGNVAALGGLAAILGEGNGLDHQ
ncbi:hypothetical protein I203_108259 [Kwoniella mangroviensis CBS 8507]|uniref:hypothetical protein n=1 Tax=Kwoniella mangroviensis CBS 8507 TaxID=1296122 RepID=UPI00080D50F8|nr:uncharacterized protein I203_05150 [Kwoniella mangroviensis CBS 8507]OCF65475.1 hypothetical protein I203_05150 [Kwoniella mangroviensis CBS 8507]